MKNYVAMVLDKSGSMEYLSQQAIGVFNAVIESLKENSLKNKVETYLTLIRFDTKVVVDYENKDVRFVEKIESFPCSGMTALFDSVAEAIFSLKKKKAGKDDAYLIYVVTDGQENSSEKFRKGIGMTDLLVKTHREGNWTITFQVPPHTTSVLVGFGIPTDNIREWESTEAGLKQVEVVTSAAIGNYFGARAVGAKAVKNFYKVDVDLSGTKAKDFKKLKNLSKHFKSFNVEKEYDIKQFVEFKTKKEYEPGSTYYLLMKNEKIQLDKEVLIIEKGKKSIYGGDEARQLIGLPLDGDAKVNPYNLQNYEIYVQSKSLNRKLPRGTKILVKV